MMMARHINNNGLIEPHLSCGCETKMVSKHAIFFLHVFQSCQEKSDLSYFKTDKLEGLVRSCLSFRTWNESYKVDLQSLLERIEARFMHCLMHVKWLIRARTPPPFAHPPVLHSGCLCHPLSVNFCNWQFNSFPLHGIIHHLGSCEGGKKKIRKYLLS